MAGDLFLLSGMPAEIRSSARGWNKFGETATQTGTDLRGLSLPGFQGDEANLHREKVGEYPPKLSAVEQAWSQVSTALTSYASALESCQSRLTALAGDHADQSAQVARADSAVADARTADVRHSLDREALSESGAELPEDTYRSAAPGALAGLQQAQAQLRATSTAAAQVRAEHEAAVSACVAAIEAAAALRVDLFRTQASAFSISVNPAGRTDPLTLLAGVLRGVSGFTSLLPYLSAMRSIMAPIAQAAGGPDGAAIMRMLGLTRPGSATTPGKFSSAVWKNNGALPKFQLADSDWPGWMDNTSRHNRARDWAMELIKIEVIALGGDPNTVSREFPVDKGAKDGLGGTGKADIVWTDKNTNTMYVWEVKGTGTPGGVVLDAANSKLAGQEVIHYIKHLQTEYPTMTVVPGFPIPPTTGLSFQPTYLPGLELLTVKSGTDPGAIIYNTQRPGGDPKRVPVPKPVPVPRPVPVPVPLPVPNPVPGPVPVPPEAQPAPGQAPALPPEVIAGGAVVGGGALLWWLGKLASPFCGPLAPVCVVVL